MLLSEKKSFGRSFAQIIQKIFQDPIQQRECEKKTYWILSKPFSGWGKEGKILNAFLGDSAGGFLGDTQQKSCLFKQYYFVI